MISGLSNNQRFYTIGEAAWGGHGRPCHGLGRGAGERRPRKGSREAGSDWGKVPILKFSNPRNPKNFKAMNRINILRAKLSRGI